VRTTLLTIGFLVAFSTLAFADGRADIECKKTETQPECFARLKCHAKEELEDCQKRLIACTTGQSLDACESQGAGTQGNAGGQGDNGHGDNGRGDRGDNGRGDRGDDGRGDRGDNGRGDNGRGDRGDNGRGDRGDNGRGDHSDRYDRGERRRRRGGGSRSGGFEANKTFGLGVELGEPDGLNGKVFVSRTGAIDFGVGEIYDHYYYGNGFHIYGDYLWHPALLAATPSFELPFYVGVGLRFWDFDYCYMNVCDYSGTAVGVRVPLGISFDFNNVPLDIFLQVVPVLDFLGGDYYTRFGDREHFGIDGSVGIRVWFK
jgi:hypothetical protein